jgi:hypothetical protein
MLACALAGCADVATIAPGTPSDQVASSAGKPNRIWPEANGAASWEYTQQPSGRAAYMVRIGADGRVTRVDQVLDWPFFNQLTPGMKANEIEHVLGRPYSVTYMPVIDRNVMAWRWVETVWKRCFFAYLSRDGTLINIGVQDEEVSDHGQLTAAPC